jgi:hypothetical protein
MGGIHTITKIRFDVPFSLASVALPTTLLRWRVYRII